MMTQMRANTSPALRSTLPLAYRVPPTLCHALFTAYARIHLLDDYCLISAELNRNMPHQYPDDSKVSEALLLLPGVDLINLSRDKASLWNAQSRCMQRDHFGHFTFQGYFGSYNPFAQFY